MLMMGDYDAQWWDDDEELTQRHLDELGALITTLRKQFVGIKYLGGHIEYALANGGERSCPGSLLIAKMPELRTSAGLVAPAAP